MRDHLKKAGRLEKTERLSPKIEYLWQWFLELSLGRQVTIDSFGGKIYQNPLSWNDINSWSNLMGITLKTWELSALKRLDYLFLRNANK